MRLSSDLREFLGLLNSRGIEYVIVGAHSLAFHGRPRYTGDLDVLIRNSSENAGKLVELLNDFGFAESAFKPADFLEPHQVIQLGRAPNRIDLLTTIDGVSTDEALATKIEGVLDDVRVFILGKEALIQNKRTVGRPQDLADIEALGG